MKLLLRFILLAFVFISLEQTWRGGHIKVNAIQDEIIGEDECDSESCLESNPLNVNIMKLDFLPVF